MQAKICGEELVAAIESYAGKPLEAMIGVQFTNIIPCPVCRGGERHDKGFGVKVIEEGCVLYHCFRGKCGAKGKVAGHRAASAGGGSPAPAATRPEGRRAAVPGERPRFVSPLTVAEAHEWAAQHTGPLIDELVEKRRLSREVLLRNGVHEQQIFFPSLGKVPAVVFPYYAEGKLVAEKYRTPPKVFSQAKGGEHTLFGVDDLQGKRIIVLVEGEVDKLSVEATGFSVASVQCGAVGGLALEYGAREALDAARVVLLATDNDEAGNKCAMDIAEKVGIRKCLRVTWRDGCKDANEVLVKHGLEAVSKDIEAAGELPPPAGVSSLKDFTPQIADRLAGRIPRDHIYGVSTGWSSLEQLYRVVPGELTVVTGTPGSGKSEWLLSLLVNLAEDHGWRFLLFEFECAEWQLWARIIHKRLRRRCADEKDMDEAMPWLDQHFCNGCDKDFGSPSIDEILKLARVEAASPEGLQGLLIDPYNCLQHKTTMPETRAINGMLAELKKFAHETSCHVWIVAHPTKASAWAGETPSLYDIAGNANWYNKCDNGIVVSRVANSFPNGSSIEKVVTNRTKVKIEKARNRDAASEGEAELLFEEKSGTYEDA